MLIALLSDTHDNARATRAALALLQLRNPAAYLHAGDLVSPDMLPLFANLPFHFVFGNNEYDRATLRSRALSLHLTCHEECADVTLANKRIALLHGHETAELHRLAHSGHYHYIIHGHTHIKKDERIAQRATSTRQNPSHPKGAATATPTLATRVINPGALHRAKVKSVALLNLATDVLEFLNLPDSHSA